MAHMAMAIASIAVMVNFAIADPQTCLKVELHVTELDRTNTYDVAMVEEREVIAPYRCVRYRGPPAPEIKFQWTTPEYLLGLKMFPQGVPLLDGFHQNNVTFGPFQRNQSFDVFVTEQPYRQQSKMQFLV
ncbi:unnamed protein product [Symbiodinium necroappetens]|uniref:Uncharacterized protein n=1 Tax=Symbiodinium necroappetens TaxID=1628268 RepID=A0A813CM53_9DINO|nr:unnamed protein product [Symbiodinium necroappetens]